MTIKMNLVRKAVLEAAGIEYREQNYYKLPTDFSSAPVTVQNVDQYFDREDRSYKLKGTYLVKVLSSDSAKATSKTRARSPHRILIWCDQHQRWVFAGKYAQHARLTHKEEN